MNEKGQLCLSMETGEIRDDLNLLSQDTGIAEEILKGVSGDMQVNVTVQAADGEEQIVRVNRMPTQDPSKVVKTT